MKPALHLAAGLLAVAFSAAAAAGPFYLFPVKEIEGLEKAASASARPLIDPAFVKRFLSGELGQTAQRNVLEQFVADLGSAYPASIIHPRQVYDINVGSGHQFVNDDTQACKKAPSFNVTDTYAVLIGITRASIYEVVKGDTVEVLIPVTLNLQFIKPHLAKVVYTLSETLYSPFRFSKAEYASGAVDALMRDVLVKNIKTQVGSLVASAKGAFNPKDVSIRLADKDGKFYVTDKGIEAGFVKGEQVEAHDGAGKDSIFNVLYADSGYAVLTLADGAASVGSSLDFVFEKSADDSRKPRLMPVISNRPEEAGISAIAEIFSKDIGFKASFQLSPVDVNFGQTKLLVTRAANCVTWQKIPSMAEASGERKDAPDFFLKFTPAVSPVTLLSGSGGTKTSERFHALVTAQVINQFGKVVFSEIGDNDYAIDKVNGAGLGVQQAQAISLKNATQKLAANFIANVRFSPKDYRVAKADKDRLWVEGLQGVSPSDKLTFDVLHPLSAKVNGKTPVMDLDVSPGAAELATDGELTGLPYSAANPALPKPQRGDLVRLYSQLTPGATKVQDCSDPTYIGKNNVVEVDYLTPLLRHAVYKSKKFASYIGDPAFYADANQLLKQGLFGMQLEKPAVELCAQPGYAIREDALQCDDPQSCKATVSMGINMRLKKGADFHKTFSTGLQTEFSGFQLANKLTFYGYKELGNGLAMQADLLNKLNQN